MSNRSRYTQVHPGTPRHTCAHIGSHNTDAGAATHPDNTFPFKPAFSSSTPPPSLAEGSWQTQEGSAFSHLVSLLEGFYRGRDSSLPNLRES